MCICCQACCHSEHIKIPADLTRQSNLLKSHGIIHVSTFYKDAVDGKFISYLYEDAKTLYETFRKGAKLSGNEHCLGFRDSISKPYSWLKYNEVLTRVRNFGSGLILFGLQPTPHTFLGIYSNNCPEWVVTEQAAYSYSMVLVSLNETLGPDACAFIINQAEISVIVVDSDSKCNQLIDRAPKCLKKLVATRDVRSPTIQRAKNRGIEIVYFRNVEQQGALRLQPERPPKPSDLCTVCYTSGTTGNPKGVMLSHANVVAAISAVLLQLGDCKPTSSDLMISYLPMAYMLERCCQNGMYLVGGSVGFFNGNMKYLAEDMKILKPTIIPAVPRLLNRIYENEMATIRPSFFKRMLFNLAMNSKHSQLKRGILQKNSLWDKLVFRKVQEIMGGKLRLMIVGSAPLAGNVLNFMRCALGCMILEGYGQTECVAPITLTVNGDCTTDHVGPPIACNAIKLADVPEMEYFASCNQGEICVKGTNVFLGYFKEMDTTLQTVDENGWHHTGDVGTWLPNGTLKIIDRKRHIFKLAQGEYVVPDKIEEIYMQSQYIRQIFVYGESLKAYLIAIVIPNVHVVKSWAVEHNMPGTLSDLCENVQIKKMILDDMAAWAKDAGLKPFEQVKDIYLHPEPFTVQNGLLTPTFKYKRLQLKSYFKPQLEDMYKKLC
ncbi:hypothetical protein PGB90_007939 [Kerria lacca]|nr:long-chain acyl-CoA synthetase [Kerria lacca]